MQMVASIQNGFGFLEQLQRLVLCPAPDSGLCRAVNGFHYVFLCAPHP